MPDQLVVRRWTRHGRRNTALATGFGVDTPIRPATAGALRSPAPPTGSAPASIVPTTANGTASPSTAPAGFATAPWVAATTGGDVPARPGPRIGRRGPAGPPAHPPIVGGAWAAAPGDRTGAAALGLPTAPPGVIAPRSVPPGPAVPASAGGPASTELLSALPVAPPRTGPVAREMPALPAPPPSAPPPSATPPGVPATFTAAEIERIRGGTGSLLERTADLFTAAPVPGAALSPSLVRGSGAGEAIDRTTGGPAVFHQTSTESHAVASSRPDPWRAGVPDPWTDGHEPEPTGATLDRIVDAVVERIEDRVIDELERRGRHEWRVV
jgi:hypothetical protein